MVSMRTVLRAGTALLIVLCMVVTGCTFPLGIVQPQAGKTKDQQELDTLFCKDKAHLAASGTGQQVGAFFLGMTLVGIPVAYALDRSTQRRVFEECMAGRGYKVIPPDDSPDSSPEKKTAEKTIGERFKEFAQTISSKPQHTAVAVVKDVKQWAWGGMWSAESPEAAQTEALARCRHAASTRSIEAPCQIYMVDGHVLDEQIEGGSRADPSIPTSRAH